MVLCISANTHRGFVRIQPGCFAYIPKHILHSSPHGTCKYSLKRTVFCTLAVTGGMVGELLRGFNGLSYCEHGTWGSVHLSPPVADTYSME